MDQYRCMKTIGLTGLGAIEAKRTTAKSFGMKVIYFDIERN